jgi:hypothetical protein
MKQICPKSFVLLSILSLEVTQEQKEAIYHFFAHNDWEFKEVQIPPNNYQSRDALLF